MASLANRGARNTALIGQNMSKAGGPIHGKPMPPYRLFKANAEGGTGEHVKDFETLDEVKAFKRRLDIKYVLQHHRQNIPFPK